MMTLAPEPTKNVEPIPFDSMDLEVPAQACGDDDPSSLERLLGRDDDDEPSSSTMLHKKQHRPDDPTPTAAAAERPAKRARLIQTQTGSSAPPPAIATPTVFHDERLRRLAERWPEFKKRAFEWLKQPQLAVPSRGTAQQHVPLQRLVSDLERMIVEEKSTDVRELVTTISSFIAGVEHVKRLIFSTRSSSAATATIPATTSSFPTKAVQQPPAARAAAGTQKARKGASLNTTTSKSNKIPPIQPTFATRPIPLQKPVVSRRNPVAPARASATSSAPTAPSGVVGASAVFFSEGRRWMKMDATASSAVLAAMASRPRPKTVAYTGENGQRYVLDFQTMVQENQQTRVRRQVHISPSAPDRPAPPPSVAAAAAATPVPTNLAARFPVWFGASPVTSGADWDVAISPLRDVQSKLAVYHVHQIQFGDANPEASFWRSKTAIFAETSRQVASRRNMSVEKVVQPAFHGTDADSILSILKCGFVSRAPKNGNCYGHGVYFATKGSAPMSASYAFGSNASNAFGPDRARLREWKYILCCDVIVGATEVVKTKDQFLASSDAYDTGIDRQSDPQRLIVWTNIMNDRVLPRFLVSFRLR